MRASGISTRSDETQTTPLGESNDGSPPQLESPTVPERREATMGELAAAACDFVSPEGVKVSEEDETYAIFTDLCKPLTDFGSRHDVGGVGGNERVQRIAEELIMCAKVVRNFVNESVGGPLLAP